MKAPALPLQSPSDPAAIRIVTAARKYFFSHGFRSVTMDDLAAEIGMSKKTLYVHFKSKRDLLAAVLQQKFAELTHDLDAIPSDNPADFALSLRRLLDCIHRHAHEVTPTFARDMSKEDPTLFATVKAKRGELIVRTFGRIFRKGQEAGAIRNDVSSDFIVDMLLAITDALATPENAAAKRVGPGEIIESILAIFLKGILTEQGRLQV